MKELRGLAKIFRTVMAEFGRQMRDLRRDWDRGIGELLSRQIRLENEKISSLRNIL